MNLLVFILVYPLIWILSKLPMKLLYFFSDIIYLILYYIIGYRKKVVRNNLKLAFPEKSEAQRLILEKKSFHHFVDIFMEMIKSFTISEKEISKRFIFKNPEIINNLYDKGQSVILMAGHYANWEWATLYISKPMKHDMNGAYKKIKNKYFDQKIKETRKRFGSNLVEAKQTVKLMITNKKNKKVSLYGLLSDQSPKANKSNYFGSFMGINVPLLTGPETLAKKFNFPIIYLQTERVKRGYYESTIKILAEKPSDFKDFQITDIFNLELEKQIRKHPELYFWTHKKFKHMKVNA